MKKRLLAILLCLSMAIALLPTVALAGWSSPGILLGANVLDYSSKVYFGTYNSEAVPWNVLNTSGFLLSEYLLGEERYYNSGSNGYYGGSLLQTVMDEIYGGFTPAEWGAIADTTLAGDSMYSGQPDLTGKKLFPLSYNEAEEIGWEHSLLRVKPITDKEGSAGVWWLRSSFGDDDAYYVLADGTVYHEKIDLLSGVRPAFNLDMSQVLITSAATGGKSSTGMDSELTEVTTLDEEPDWKLTLLDGSRSEFTAEITDLAFSGVYIDSITVAYSGAQTGTNEFISAAIVNSEGRITHYGRVKALTDAADASGSVTVNIPSEILDMVYFNNTLLIFNEQYNDDCNTDYASELLAMRLWSHTTSLDFGTVTEGYAVPEGQYINLNNITNQSVTVSLPTSSNFDISARTGLVECGDSFEIDINSTVTITVQPKDGLVAGTYNETITLSGNNSETSSIAVTFTVNPTPTYNISVTPETIFFGGMTAGYSASPAAQTVTIENTGNQSVTLTQPTATNYYIGALSTTALTATGDTATFTVQPKTGLAVGTYNENITVSGNNGASASVSVAFTVYAAPTYNISATPETIPFESMTAGYSAAPAAQTVTIENTGNQSVTLIQPTATDYYISALSTTSLTATGDVATFTVQPKTGLAAGNYDETITVSGNNGANANIALSFTILNADSYTPPTYVVPVSGSENSINATATISGSTAVVTVNAERLNALLNNKDTTGNIIINAGLNRNINTVNIRTTVIKSISDAAQDKDKAITGLDIFTDNGTVSFDKTALAALTLQANGSTVTIHVEEISQSGLTAAQQAAMEGSHKDDTIIEVTARSGNVIITDYDSGKITVTVPYTLKAGANPEGICVWHLASDGTLTLMECTYDAAAKTVSFITDHLSDFIIDFIAVNSNPDTGAWDNPFTDISESDWFYEDVALCYTLGLMKGTDDTTFSPYMNTTRGMIVTILYRLEGEPEITSFNQFTDVASDKYYTDAISWAEKNAIVYGYGGGLFGPEDSITREQMAAILYRYAQFKGYNDSIGEDTNILSYSDVSEISEYAVPAMNWACGAGIIQGNAGNLMPKDGAQRCQVAAMLIRFLNTAGE